MLQTVPKPQHKRRVPKRGKRGQFPRVVREAIVDRDNGLCQMCFAKGEEIHHIKYRSQGGRGVFTNGLLLCHLCHRKAHDEPEISEYWMNVFVDRYGENFFKDGWDL